MQQKDGRLPIMKTRLKELQGDMSATDFAKKIGLSRQTVGFYLNGDRIPDSETLIQICQSCHVSADWLLGLSEEKTMDSSAQSASLYTGLSGGAVEFLHNCPDTLTRSFFRKFFDSLILNSAFPLDQVPALILDAARAYVIAKREQQTGNTKREIENRILALSKDGSGYKISATDAEQFFLRLAQDEIQQNVQLVLDELQCEAIKALENSDQMDASEFVWIVVDENDLDGSEPKEGGHDAVNQEENQ